MPHLSEYALQNNNGCKVSLTNFGGKVMSVLVPDKNGRVEDVVLGYSTPQHYVNGNPYFGALIGRFGNRIAKGRFTLNGKMYYLPVNNRGNCLHGGNLGFHQAIWQVVSSSSQQVVLQYSSMNGEEGFPGNLNCEVSYLLTEQNEFVIEYTANTDEPTVVNLTHHGFFNLAGAGNSDVLNHKLMIAADSYCPVNENLIPTGNLEPVGGTPFNFLKPKAIGTDIELPHEQLRMGNGYDHCWELNKNTRGELSLAAKVWEPSSGRVMEVWTTEPGLQFYSGNFLDGSNIGREGKPYLFRSAFCLEAQHFPDSPNQPNFPSTVLVPTETYKQKTIYKFGIY